MVRKSLALTLSVLLLLVAVSAAEVTLVDAGPASERVTMLLGGHVDIYNTLAQVEF